MKKTEGRKSRDRVPLNDYDLFKGEAMKCWPGSECEEECSSGPVNLLLTAEDFQCQNSDSRAEKICCPTTDLKQYYINRYDNLLPHHRPQTVLY
jgi:hypothetical protein